ncbi:hypothetical protein ACFYY8_03240 [Streptosporangium sp. NPDC001559]|uniref:hypothetical protein n=1 Tax=Streptosporangium sp. NPDC001559 TaxID=3366187 RepID=UPI0036E20977
MRFLTMSIGTVAALAALGVAVAPAVGASPSPSASPSPVSLSSLNTVGQASPAGRHCVVHLTASKPSIVLSSENTTCYTTFTAAIADATGGAITNAPADTATAMADSDLKRRINALNQGALDQTDGRTASVRPTKTPQPPNVVGIEYEHGNWGGGSYTFQSPYGCRKDVGVDYEVSSLSGWLNNAISSYETYGGCWVMHYENENFKGNSTSWEHDSSWIGADMNDKTSSIRWS